MAYKQYSARVAPVVALILRSGNVDNGDLLGALALAVRGLVIPGILWGVWGGIKA
jgi:hypothetical protein